MHLIAIERERSERAWRAYHRANEMLPQWHAFACMLARRPNLQMRLSSRGSYTDGKTVWIRVPIELGDDTPHDPALCGLRGADHIQACEACKTLEHIRTSVIHEISHIVHDTFQAVDDDERRKMIDHAIRLECGGDDASPLAKAVKTRIDGILPKMKDLNYMTVASLVSPFLPMLLNAIEDVYVNTEMMGQRAGTRVMFSAQTNLVFTRGVQRDDGSVMRWSEQPVNAQAIIGVYCKGSGLEYGDWLDADVVAALEGDFTVRTLCAQIVTARTAQDRYRLAIRMLEALRALGFLLSEDDLPEDPAGDGEGEPGESGDSSDSDESSDDSSGKSQSKDKDDSSGSPESSDDDEQGDAGDQGEASDANGDDSSTGADSDQSGDSSPSDADGADSDAPAQPGDLDTPVQHGDGEPGEHDSGDGSEKFGRGPSEQGDAEEVETLVLIFGRHDHDDNDDSSLTKEEQADREAVEIALNQAEHYDEPSEGTSGLKEYRFDDAKRHRAFSHHPHLDKPDEGIMAPALAKMRIAFTNNRKNKLERNLTRGSHLDARVLGRRIPTEDYRLFAKRERPGKKDYFVVIGLDCSGSTSGKTLDRIKMAAGAQADLLHRTGVKFAMYAHSGDGKVTIFTIKDPNEPWGDKQRLALASLGPFMANLDGHTLEYYRKVAQRSPATDKMILYYTDGAMPLENYAEELRVLKRNIDICRRSGILLVGVGVGTDSPKQHGLDTIRLDRDSDIPKVVDGLRERISHR